MKNTNSTQIVCFSWTLQPLISFSLVVNYQDCSVIFVFLKYLSVIYKNNYNLQNLYRNNDWSNIFLLPPNQIFYIRRFSSSNSKFDVILVFISFACWILFSDKMFRHLRKVYICLILFSLDKVHNINNSTKLQGFDNLLK